MGGILAVTEIREGRFRKAGLEVVSEAIRQSKRLGIDAAALVAGSKVRDLAPDLGKYGMNKVFVAEQEKFAGAYVGAYVEAVALAMQQAHADYVFFPATTTGKTIAAMIAARNETSAFTDCTGFQAQGDNLIVQRPIYSGKIILTVSCAKKPLLATLRPNIFPVEEVASPVQPALVDLQVDFSKPSPVEVLETQAAASGKLELTEAPVIVSGGRGMKGPEHFHLVEKLAEVLGAATGASRAVVDAGWRPAREQVGQTGKTVSPQLYIACGISGAIQHLAGMRTSKIIVAVNKDPEAPIFQVADYGIVGDVFEVLPKMIEAAQQLKGK